MAQEIGTQISIDPTQTAANVKRKMPLMVNTLNKMDPSELRHLVTDMQTKLDQVEDLNVDLRVQLANAVEERDIFKKKVDKPRQNEQNGAADEAERKHIHEQLLYKDTRIMELNQMIMERERRIIDLQEAFSEQGEVARSKQLAVLLLGKRLQELDTPPRERKDVGTTTEYDGASSGGTGARVPTASLRWPATSAARGGGAGCRSPSRARSPQRNASPGRAIPQLLRVGVANGSPPPLDPTAEDGCSSYTTDNNTLSTAMDGAAADGSVAASRKKSATGRKKVTFFDTDGTPTGQHQQRHHHQHMDGMVRRIGTPPPLTDQQQQQSGKSPKSGGIGAADVSADFEELMAENEQLRRTISEMEKQQQQVNTENRANEEPLASSVLILKAKAAAQAKIRELEASLTQHRLLAESERVELRSAIDQLKESREWALEENAKLLQQLEVTKQKCDDLHGELDASLETSVNFRRRLDENAKRMEAMCTEMHQSRAQTQQALDDKNIICAEVERLKDAVFAQDEFIATLEGDLLVYEAHVGILRDSLGATKREDRQHIKTKAFTAKLNALEMEKREIAKRNNDEKLRTKALTVKVRCLEQERDELNARLRQYECAYGISREQPLKTTAPREQRTQRQQSSHSSTAAENAATTQVLCAISLGDPIGSSSPTATINDDDHHHDDDDDDECLALTKSEQHQQQKDVEAVVEQLRLDHAQQIEAVQALKHQAEERVQQLGLELMRSQESVQKFVDSITKFVDFLANRQMPSPAFNTIVVPINPSNRNSVVVMDSLDCVQRFVDELLNKFNELTEVRAVLEQKVRQLNAENSQTKADHAVREQELCAKVDRLEGQLHHYKDKLESVQREIESMSRINAHLTNDLNTKSSELSNALNNVEAWKDANRRLEERSAELCAQIDTLNGIKLTLCNDLQQANAENASLSNTLANEQTRLNRLVNILNEIVGRFRSAAAVTNGGTGTTSNSSELSLDELMQRIEAVPPPLPPSSSSFSTTTNRHQQNVGLSSQPTMTTTTCLIDDGVGQQQHGVALADGGQARGAVVVVEHQQNNNNCFTGTVPTSTNNGTSNSSGTTASLPPMVFTSSSRHAAAVQTWTPIQCDSETQSLSIGELMEPLLSELERQQEQIRTLEQQQEAANQHGQLSINEAETRREYVEQQLVESRERMQCLETMVDQLQCQLTVVRAELSQTGLKLEEEKNARAAECDFNKRLQMEIGTLRTANEQLNERIVEENATIAVVEESTRNTVSQLLANVDPEFASPPFEQLQHVMHDACTQASADDGPFPLALVSPTDAAVNLSSSAVDDKQQVRTPLNDDHHRQRQEHCSDHPVAVHPDHSDHPVAVHPDHADHPVADHEHRSDHPDHHGVVHAHPDHSAAAAKADQQHRQLLLECIQDRQQFEQELGQNVQQLLTLKTELENSVDVLRAEIWALNDQLKKVRLERNNSTSSCCSSSPSSNMSSTKSNKFDERDKLSQRLHTANAQLDTLRAENAQLVAKLNANERRMDTQLSEALEKHEELRVQLEDANRRVDELKHAKEQETGVLTARLALLQTALLDAKNLLSSWRTDMHTLKAQQYKLSDCCIESMRDVAAQIVEHAKAARLVTKTRDVEALVRENQLLIDTNARLQDELEQYNDRNSNNESALEQQYTNNSNETANAGCECDEEGEEAVGDQRERSTVITTDDEEERAGNEELVTNNNESASADWGWKEEATGDQMQRQETAPDYDGEEMEKREFVTPNNSRQFNDTNTENANNADWGWNEEGEGVVDDQSRKRSDTPDDEEEGMEKEELVVTTNEEQNYNNNDNNNRVWGWDEEGESLDDQRKRSTIITTDDEEERVGNEELVTNNNESASADWGWNGEGEEATGDQVQQQETTDYDEEEMKKREFLTPNNSGQSNDTNTENANNADWGWNEEGEGVVDDQSRKRSDTPDDEEEGMEKEELVVTTNDESASTDWRELITPNPSTATTTLAEPKTIFDNLVDWAWGDK